MDRPLRLISRWLRLSTSAVARLSYRRCLQLKRSPGFGPRRPAASSALPILPPDPPLHTLRPSPGFHHRLVRAVARQPFRPSPSPVPRCAPPAPPCSRHPTARVQPVRVPAREDATRHHRPRLTHDQPAVHDRARGLSGCNPTAGAVDQRRGGFVRHGRRRIKP